ncbi:MAG: DUF1570 domain-containing protein, partial [Thermoguttaceae bacterium]
LFDELVAERDYVNQLLVLPFSDEPIHVYLFENEERFNAFMKIFYPDFPRRRSFFIETDTKLSVYARWGNRIGEDLRHEFAHGYIHSTTSNLPLWLDEGLAEYFEVPRSQEGLNRNNLKLLVRRMEQEHWRPDLRRLEQLDPTEDLSQKDYAESWAWAHFLLQTRPEYAELLRSYISQTRRLGAATSLAKGVFASIGDPNAALLEHLKILSAGI